MSFLSGSGNLRGGCAPRRGRGGRPRPFVKHREPVKPDLDKHPLGELILTLQPSDVVSSETRLVAAPRIGDCRPVASYNWVASKDSTILVPGQPPQWTPPKGAQTLPEDSGTYYRDPNAARHPGFPMAPAVQATMDTTSSGLIDADVFACGSTLGNLLRFARGIDKAFRLSVEVIGDTVFLIRKENDPKELIEGVRGFGHTFPEAYTTWPSEVKGSETHQRVIQYNLGGLQCFVRFECDGFLNPSSNTSKPQSSSTGNSPPLSPDEALNDAFLNTTITTPQPNDKSPLRILHAGKTVPHASIFDLKTRSNKHGKEINMDDITPQLWLKQVPNFIVAYHNGHGLFSPEEIHVQDARPRIQTFEKDNAEAISRFVALLRKIVDTAKADAKGLLEVYCPGAEKLEIRRQFGEGVHALPPVLHERWVAMCEGGGLALGHEDTGYGASADEVEGALSESSAESEDGQDFTACSVEDCGYCGRCTY